MDLHLIPVEDPDDRDEPQVDPAGLSGLTWAGNFRMVTRAVSQQKRDANSMLVDMLPAR
jgi:hypothetical protein